LIDLALGRSVLCKKKLPDYEMASNIGRLPWGASVSRVDAAPYFRIFNPTEQAKQNLILISSTSAHGFLNLDSIRNIRSQSLIMLEGAEGGIAH
jgi:hypothetical protein